MHLFMIFIVSLSCFLSIANSRPPHLQEENDSELGGGEYDSEESVDDEYVPEDNEPAMDEDSQKLSSHDNVVQGSEDQELIQDAKPHNSHFEKTREDSEKIAETKMNIRKEGDENISKGYLGEKNSDVKEHPEYVFGVNSEAEPEGLEYCHTGSQRNRVEYRNLDDNSKKITADNSGDSLFKRFYDHLKKDSSDYIDATEKSNIRKQNDYKPLHTQAQTNYDYLDTSDGSRREIRNVEEKPAVVKNNNLDLVNDSDILKSINKLSEQDLVDLMNSLPEDKKALLKKVMDKREITKKAGAIEDNSNLDQSDINKVEGSYSVNTNSVSSLLSNTDTTENNKHNENGGGLNTKVSDSESETGKSGSKSGERSDSTTTEELLRNSDTALKDQAIINSKNKESLRNENKREINQKYKNENAQLENSLDLDTKNCNNFPIHEDSSEDEDWLEPKDEDLIAEKREVSQSDPADLTAAAEKLQDSFPNVNADDDIESVLEPLIRIKRKEIHHNVKKRDLPFLSNGKVSCHSDFDNKGYENEENGESNYKDYLYSQSGIQQKCLESGNYNFINKRGLRKKRALSTDETIIKNYLKTINLARSSNTTGPTNTENIAEPDYFMDKLQHRTGGSFGPFMQNSNEFEQYKKLNEEKDFSNSSITDVF